MRAEDRLTKILKLLQGAIRAAGMTQTEVDEKIGRRRGYLSHVFQRRVDLKMIDLLNVLRVIGVEPRRFFTTAVATEAGRRSSLDEVMEMVSDFRKSAPPDAWRQRSSREPDHQALIKKVRPVIRRILEERRAHEEAVAAKDRRRG